MSRVFVLSFIASTLWTVPAYAYVDPGTATIVLQGLIGVLAVVGIYFREKVAMIFRLLKPGGSSKTATGKDGEETSETQKTS